jgi:hypothetical protein
MKYTLLTLLACAWLVTLSAQSTEFERLNLFAKQLKKQHVKTIKIWNENHQLLGEKQVDTRGNITGEWFGNYDTDLSEITDTVRISYQYHPKGCLKLAIFSGYDEIYHYYEYSEKGKLLSESITGSEPRIYDIIWDSQNKHILKKIGKTVFPQYDEDKEPNSNLPWVEIDEYQYQYTHNGNILLEQFFFSHQLMYSTEFTFDKKNRITSITQKNPDNSTLYAKTYQYNKTNLISQTTELIEEHNTIHEHYEYIFY